MVVMKGYKEIPGTDGMYLVNQSGDIYSVRSNKTMKPKITKDGYYYTAIRRNGKIAWIKYHRIVAEVFISNPDGLETVNHKDGNKQNNTVDNLEWANRSMQMFHAYAHGLKKPMRGEENHASKLTREQAEEIRRKYVRQSKTNGTVALAREYGVSDVVIGHIVRGESYV